LRLSWSGLLLGVDDAARLTLLAGPAKAHAEQTDGKSDTFATEHGADVIGVGFSFLEVMPERRERPHRVVCQLPLANGMGRAVALYVPLLASMVPHIGEPNESLPSLMNQVRPTYVMGVPRTWEKIVAHVQVAVDSAGNVYFTTQYSNYQHRVWKITKSTGTLSIVAGTYYYGYSGDGGLAINAQLYFPRGLAVDHAGNVFFADVDNQIIREVNAGTGIITTIAGTPQNACSGVCGWSPMVG